MIKSAKWPINYFQIYYHTCNDIYYNIIPIIKYKYVPFTCQKELTKRRNNAPSLC